MIRVRFAPSPTGYLHLGNARTALFNFLFAKKEKGQFILRVEDTDPERSRPEYEKAQREDLRWLGIQWDEGPDRGGAFGPYRQSERREIYEHHLRRLMEEGRAYECYVTPEEIEEMKAEARAGKRPLRFDNRGRLFSQKEIAKRKNQGIRPTVRFKIENPRLRVRDLVRGEVDFNLDEMVGDFVLRRADGMPTFHLVVCVDDALMKISHVIRGEDHLPNTPRHILLHEAMGFEPPRYGHLSLVHGPSGEALSKRFDSVSIRSFRRQGYLPQALANYIALLGWSPGDNREVLSWEDLIGLFDIRRMVKSSASFDPDKLNWMNGEHLRMLSDDAFAQEALSYLKSQGQFKDEESGVRRMLPVFKDKIRHFDELPAHLKILSDEVEYVNAGWIKSKEGRAVLAGALLVLAEMREADYDAFTGALKSQVAVRGKELFMPLRVALTGCEHGPELRRVFPALGLERVMKRLKRAQACADAADGSDNEKS